MSNLLIIDTAKIPKNPTTAHSRNSIVLARELECDLISTIEEIHSLKDRGHDTFIIVGSAFYPQTAEIEREIRRVSSPKIIWFNNEYQTSPNSEYLRLMRDFKHNAKIIANLEEHNNRVKHYSQYYFLNVNLLLYNSPNAIIDKKYDICYYGSYRPDRRLYFQKYFTDKYIHVSSSTKNLKKFYQLAGGCAIWCDRFSWRAKHETLNLFKYSLYIEDEYSHRNFTHLANRFYEALSCNVVMFFDSSCRNTVERSGIYLDEHFYIDSADELKQKIKESDFSELLSIQKKWNDIVSQERAKLIKDIKEAILS